MLIWICAKHKSAELDEAQASACRSKSVSIEHRGGTQACTVTWGCLCGFAGLRLPLAGIKGSDVLSTLWKGIGPCIQKDALRPPFHWTFLALTLDSETSPQHPCCCLNQFKWSFFAEPMWRFWLFPKHHTPCAGPWPALPPERRVRCTLTPSYLPAPLPARARPPRQCASPLASCHAPPSRLLQPATAGVVQRSCAVVHASAIVTRMAPATPSATRRLSARGID